MSVGVLSRIGNGNDRAIKDCIDLYGRFVWNLARHLAETPADAHGATQEIFIEIWRNANLYDESMGSEAEFIANIARRCLIGRGRTRLVEPVIQAGEAGRPSGLFCQIDPLPAVASALGVA